MHRLSGGLGMVWWHCVKSGLPQSEIHVLDGFYYSGPWIHHESLAGSGPYLLHERKQFLGVRHVVEVQVDRDKIWIVNPSRDSVASNSRTFAVGRITVKCLLPHLETRHCVLNSKRWHLFTSPMLSLWLMLLSTSGKFFVVANWPELFDGVGEASVVLVSEREQCRSPIASEA